MKRENEWTLIVRNSQGASVMFAGNSKKEVTQKFLSEYESKGWKRSYAKNGELQ